MINHEIQFDGQEDFENRKVDFADAMSRMAAELPPEDQIVARIIMAGDDDLLVGVKHGVTTEQALEVIDQAAADRQKALAAVRPPAPVQEPEQPQGEGEPAQSENQDVKELEEFEAETETEIEEPATKKKGRK